MRRVREYEKEKCKRCGKHNQVVFNKRLRKLLCDQCHRIIVQKYVMLRQQSRAARMDALSTADPEKLRQLLELLYSAG